MELLSFMDLLNQANAGDNGARKKRLKVIIVVLLRAAEAIKVLAEKSARAVKLGAFAATRPIPAALSAAPHSQRVNLGRPAGPVNASPQLESIHRWEGDDAQ
ncbi:hypothetical protein [Pseudarthrobacter sulfonivorans]|uniref:hypothetical protein n=1 Tax=Pseudarthrobacter sulfonivorans TaxID=121292 RepID=UPI002856DBCA|nr:hypothetical protein [Pseudarthrobacter sulfonivorans]MDR6417285.1 hypothetical protein [Pseudarthrobacter sulfonivorans]